MAGGARKLPKWQAPANPVPNDATANGMPNKIFLDGFLFLDF